MKYTRDQIKNDKFVRKLFLTPEGKLTHADGSDATEYLAGHYKAMVSSGKASNGQNISVKMFCLSDAQALLDDALLLRSMGA